MKFFNAKDSEVLAKLSKEKTLKCYEVEDRLVVVHEGTGTVSENKSGKT